MKHYELTYLITPDISEQEATSLSTEVNSLIKEKEGLLWKNLSLLKKQLSYPVKKKLIAYLASTNFQIKEEKLEEIKKELTSNSKILRYLILVTTKEKPKTISKAIKVPVIIKKTKKISAPKKVDLKEIEKKLEEIL